MEGKKPRDGDPMFIFAELAGPDDGTEPRTLSFANAEVQPLDYGALRDARLHRPLAIPFVCRNGQVVDTTIEGIDPGKRVSASATLESPFTSHAIGLVKGGWLPSAFAVAHQNTTVLVDRNVVTQIVGRFENGQARRSDRDFLDLFADQPIRINPLLYAMEGNGRTIPTKDEAQAQLLEVESKLRSALPHAEIAVGPDSLKGILGLLDDSRGAMEGKQIFLRHIAPALTSPVARGAVEERWREVVSAADLFGVRRNSLVVLAALSAVAVPNGRSPARRLLKFRNGYTAGDAYNALADLRAIEIFVSLLALFPDEAIQLCTADKNLALLWVGIQASDFEHGGSGFSYAMTPVEDLFPGETGRAWESVVEGER
ncbi:hypothetical protein [Novosphingobium album (ex Liu et al. 2023)]|uniref:Type I-U CRISPR-associated protein Cas7 n=1 Tax=Novosphingobium album (ex Liu et al. 2023) TaxID=3031130 RepID=A0ABT5WWK2_9SPHN|nr:hypothetical protein [Novosphingobium album (ex Liu et al. 2023)]MDE8654268.1 hypothetical protein [Novosphingobium album (ex Liu et al. 2023)]